MFISAQKIAITDLQTLFSPWQHWFNTNIQMNIRLEYTSIRHQLANYMQQYILHVIRLKNSTNSIQGPEQSTNCQSQNVPCGLHRQQHLYTTSYCNGDATTLHCGISASSNIDLNSINCGQENHITQLDGQNKMINKPLAQSVHRPHKDRKAHINP